MKLTDAITLFLGTYQKRTTRDDYAFVLHNLSGFIGPDRPVERLEPRHLVEFVNDIYDRGYSQTTVNKFIKSTKTFFNRLVAWDIVKQSPATSLKTRKVSKTVPREKAMTDEEFHKLLEFVQWKPRDYALILFIADTGCRAGGASTLRVEDLDLENRTAVVTEKGDKTRPVWYGEECAQALRVWLIKRPAGAGVYVFSRTGQPIKPDNISQIIRRNCQKVGIRDGHGLGSHSLRHRKGYHLADAKVAPTVAATALGHEDPRTLLDHYYPKDFDRAEQAIRQLSEPSHDPAVRVIKFRQG